MSLLTLNATGVILSEPLFTDLSLTLSKGDRLGLVAANGRGKSTLLSLCGGTLEPTTGEITRARGLRVAHVAQDLPTGGETLHDHVRAALPPDQAEYESWRVDVVLDDLAVPWEIQMKPLDALSGGWRRTALLAAAWITEPDVLLLDEPTNHLDLARIGLLQGWLARLPRDVACVIVSHDRAFLDATTNRTLFLRPAESRAFALPFTPARAALDEADAADARRHANDMAKANQLRRQAAKLKNIGINSGSDLLVTKTRQLKDRADRLEAAAKPAHRERSAGDIRLGNADTHAKALVTLPETEISAPDGTALYRAGPLWINRGDRVVLLGPNGSGKTSLIRLVHAALQGRDGPVRAAPSVSFGYSDQALSLLSDSRTPMQTIAGQFDVGDQRARGLLAAAGIDISRQDNPLDRLSGGQKARLAMLVLRLRQPNFYLLDEPTNHLDIDGQEALEDELTAHGATCLLVSHDRSFVRNTGTRFWQIDRRRLLEVESPEPFFEVEMARA